MNGSLSTQSARDTKLLNALFKRLGIKLKVNTEAEAP